MRIKIECLPATETTIKKQVQEPLVLTARNMMHFPSRHKDMKDLCFVVQELENTSWQ